MAIWILHEYYGYFGRVFVSLQIWEVVEGENFDPLRNFIDILFSLEVLEYLCHLKISRGFIFILEIELF